MTEHDIETLTRLNNEYHTRMVKAEKEVQDIKNTIRTMMDNERTHLGYNALKQLYDAIME